MKTLALVTTLILAVLIAPIAAAQMTGGGGMHRGQTPPGGIGSGGPMAGMDRSLAVGSDGVLYVLRNVGAATAAGSGEVVAIRPSGVVAWTAKVQGGVHRIELAGSSVLVATGPNGGAMGRWPAGGTASSSVISLSVATGSVRWQSTFEGVIAEVEPFAGGTYVLIHAPDLAGNVLGMKRAVAAIDDSGRVLWKIDID